MELEERLNPYYTGIHLHLLTAKEMSSGWCLNPYYTGIHLHDMFPSLSLQDIVLILIILEYIYITIEKEEVTVTGMS